MTLGIQPSTAWVSSLQNHTRLMQHHRCFHIIFPLSRSKTLWPNPISKFLPLPLVFKWTVSPQNRDMRKCVWNLRLRNGTSLCNPQMSSNDVDGVYIVTGHFQHGVFHCDQFSWKSCNYHNANCHLSDEDRKAWTLAIRSQLYDINQAIILQRTLLRYHPLPLVVLLYANISTSASYSLREDAMLRYVKMWECCAQTSNNNVTSAS